MNRMITPGAPGPTPARQAVAALQRNSIGRGTRSTYTRVLRPETRSPRAVVAVTLASVIIAGCVYSGAELVLALLGRPALIAAPGDVVRYLSQVNRIAPNLLLPAGVLAAVGGTVLVLVALLPGRRTGHAADHDNAGVLVDAEVTAAPLLSEGPVPANLIPDSADVAPARRTATVRPAPEPGAVTNRFTAAKAMAEALAYDSLRPTLEPTVVHSPQTRVSA